MLLYLIMSHSFHLGSLNIDNAQRWVETTEWFYSHKKRGFHLAKYIHRQIVETNSTCNVFSVCPQECTMEEERARMQKEKENTEAEKLTLKEERTRLENYYKMLERREKVINDVKANMERSMKKLISDTQLVTRSVASLNGVQKTQDDRQKELEERSVQLEVWAKKMQEAQRVMQERERVVQERENRKEKKDIDLKRKEIEMLKRSKELESERDSLLEQNNAYVKNLEEVMRLAQEERERDRNDKEKAMKRVEEVERERDSILEDKAIEVRPERDNAVCCLKKKLYCIMLIMYALC